jgi:hypothetical protein
MIVFAKISPELDGFVVRIKTSFLCICYLMAT